MMTVGSISSMTGDISIVLALKVKRSSRGGRKYFLGGRTLLW